MRPLALKILIWTFGLLFSVVIFLTSAIFIFQDKICSLVINEIAKEMSAPVEYKDVGLTFWSTFPSMSVDINGVLVKDAYRTHQSSKTLLKTERIRLQFNPIDLWRGNYDIKLIDISPGELNIRVAKDGDVNYQIFKPSSEKTTTKYNIKLSAIRLNKVKINYINQSTNQTYQTDFFTAHVAGDFDQEKFHVYSDGQVYLHKIKSGQISLLKNQVVDFSMVLNVNHETGVIDMPKTKLMVSGMPFVSSGRFTNDSLSVRVKSQNIKLTELVQALSVQEAGDPVKKLKGEGAIDFDLKLNGGMQSTDPLNIACDFSVEKGQLIEPMTKMKIGNIFLKGSYSSDGTPDAEQLTLDRLHFNTVAGPFSAALKISHFSAPKISGRAKGKLNLKALNAIYKSKNIDKIAGLAKVNTNFSLQVKESVQIDQCNGDLELSHVSCKLRGDQRKFEHINGLFNLKGSHVKVSQASLSVSGSDLSLDGQFTNIFNYFYNKGKLGAQATLRSRYIDVADLGTTSKAQKKESQGKTFVIPEDIDGQIEITAGVLKYENHLFQNVTTAMNLTGRKLRFNHLALTNGQADIYGQVEINEKQPEKFYIQADLNSENISFQPLFKEWNNFDQSVLTAEQISGKAAAKINFYAPFDLIGGIVLDEIDAKVHMKVHNGHLKNISSFAVIVESMRSNSGKLLIGKKNTDAFETKLKDIAFETLENELIIKNGKIDIPSMHIASSALDLDLSGTHTFKNDIDYKMSFRFRDLMHDDSDSEFGTVVDDGTGIRVFLRMYGNIDNPTVVWDKGSRKENLKENLESEKKTVKDMLKTEFGVFKKDSTVKEYKPVTIEKEVVRVKTEPTEPNGTKAPKQNQEVIKPKKLKNTINQWKEDQIQTDAVVVVKKGK